MAKAQPRAAQLLGATLLQAVEALEDFLQLVGGNTRARVVHADDADTDAPLAARALVSGDVLLAHLHEHVAAFAVVADGVFHQVVDHLLEQGLVALDR